MLINGIVLEDSVKPGRCWPKKAAKQAIGQTIAKRIHHQKILARIELDYIAK